MDRDRFFSLAAPKTDTVEIRDGETVTIQALSAGQLIDYVKANASDDLGPARSIVASVRNGDGWMFTEADIPRLMAMDQDIITRLNQAIKKLNKFDGESAKN